MGSPFQRAFSGKSPLNKHGKLQRKLDKVNKGKMGSEGQGGIDYELKSQLQDQIKAAKADHSKKEDNSIVEEERENSRDESSKSTKASPLNKENPHPAGTAAHDAFIKREAKQLKESTKTMELSKTPEGRKELASRKKDKQKKK